MATRYLLACSCGREIPVEAGQAGDRVACECGNSVAVPKLGELRLRPRIEAAERKTAWSARHGLLTVGILVAVASLFAGVYFYATTPERGLETAVQTDAVNRYFDSLAPWETWRHWTQSTVPLAREGLQEHETPRSLEFDQVVQQRTTYQRIAFGLAGFALLFCIVVALWRPT